MNAKKASALLAPALIALAACATGSPQAATTAPPAPAPSVSSPPPAPAAQEPHGVTLAPSGLHLPPGPFAIKPLHCGRFTAAQRSHLGTTAKGGLVYRFTNTGSAAGAPSVSVNFTDGSTVAATNVTGDISPVQPGQNAIGEVDAVGGGGGNVHFTGCQLTEYAIVTDAGGQPGSYAP